MSLISRHAALNTVQDMYERCDNFANCAIVGVATCSCKTPEEAIAAWNHRKGERYDTTESQ